VAAGVAWVMLRRLLPPYHWLWGQPVGRRAGRRGGWRLRWL